MVQGRCWTSWDSATGGSWKGSGMDIGGSVCGAPELDDLCRGVCMCLVRHLDSTIPCRPAVTSQETVSSRPQLSPVRACSGITIQPTCSHSTTAPPSWRAIAAWHDSGVDCSIDSSAIIHPRSHRFGPEPGTSRRRGTGKERTVSTACNKARGGDASRGRAGNVDTRRHQISGSTSSTFGIGRPVVISASSRKSAVVPEKPKSAAVSPPIHPGSSPTSRSEAPSHSLLPPAQGMRPRR